MGQIFDPVFWHAQLDLISQTAKRNIVILSSSGSRLLSSTGHGAQNDNVKDEKKPDLAFGRVHLG